MKTLEKKQGFKLPRASYLDPGVPSGPKSISNKIGNVSPIQQVRRGSFERLQENTRKHHLFFFFGGGEEKTSLFLSSTYKFILQYVVVFFSSGLIPIHFIYPLIPPIHSSILPGHFLLGEANPLRNNKSRLNALMWLTSCQS